MLNANVIYESWIFRLIDDMYYIFRQIAFNLNGPLNVFEIGHDITICLRLCQTCTLRGFFFLKIEAMITKKRE